MIFLQLAIDCLIFTAIVKLAVVGGPVNGLFFYPKAVQDRAVELGLSDYDTIKRRFRWFMTAFYVGMAAVLILIVGVWNGVSDFWTAYVQALLFLEVMNWYDGLVIDMLWVGHSSFWAIPELAGVPYAQTWGQMLKKRLLLSAVWVVGAALVAGIVVLLL